MDNGTVAPTLSDPEIQNGSNLVLVQSLIRTTDFKEPIRLAAVP